MSAVFGRWFFPGLVVLAAGFRRDRPEQVYWLAFAAGLLADFLAGRVLGTSSIFLLFLAAAVFGYRQKFKAGWQAFILLAVFSQVLAGFFL